MAPAPSLRLACNTGRAPGAPRSIWPRSPLSGRRHARADAVGARSSGSGRATRPYEVINSARHTGSSGDRSPSFWPGEPRCLWTGDLETAEECIDATIYQAESNSLGPFVAIGRARKAELAICRGNAKDGVESLQTCLKAIHALGYELLTTELNIALVQGLAATGQFAEACRIGRQDHPARRGERRRPVHAGIAARERPGAPVDAARRVDDAESCFTHHLN